MTRIFTGALVLLVAAALSACATTKKEVAVPDATPAMTLAGIYAGTWYNEVGTGGRLAFQFSQKNGETEGELVDTSGSTLVTLMGSVPLGRLRWLKVTGNTVAFETPIGADYRLVRQPDGCLAGCGVLVLWGRGAPPVKVKVCPQ